MRLLVTCMLLIIYSTAYSQSLNLDSSQVQNSTIEFNGGRYNGYLVEFNAPPDIVSGAIIEHFKLQGVKPKEKKDFMVYRNVVMPLIDQVKPMDAFIKVEKKSKKEKEQTIVYFIAALPGEIPEDKPKSDAVNKSAGITKGGAFLTGLIPNVKQAVYNNDVANQQSKLKKEEKKLANLADELTEMEKKLKKLQSDIEFNKKAQERQTTDIENSRKALNELLSRDPAKGTD